MSLDFVRPLGRGTLKQMRVLLTLALCLALAGCEARGSSVRGDVVLWPADGAPPDLTRPPDIKKPADKPQATPDKPQPTDWWKPPPDKPPPPDLPPPPDMGQPDLPPPPVCKDGYEPNNNCSASKYLGSSTQGAAWVTRSATLDPGSDVDWFSAKGLEKNHSCFPGTSQKFTFKVRVQVPAGRSFKVCVYKGSCSGSSSCGSGAGPTQVEVTYKVKGICALNDDTEARILVQNLSTKGGCPPYSVSFYYAD